MPQDHWTALESLNKTGVGEHLSEPRSRPLNQIIDRIGHEPVAGGSPYWLSGAVCYEGNMMIEAKTSIPTSPFEFAAEIVRAWFPEAEVRGDACVIHLGPRDLERQEARERVCSICGNTPGLADAIVKSIEENHPAASANYELRIIIQRDNDAKIPFNHPRENAERVRRALP